MIVSTTLRDCNNRNLIKKPISSLSSFIFFLFLCQNLIHCNEAFVLRRRRRKRTTDLRSIVDINPPTSHQTQTQSKLASQIGKRIKLSDCLVSRETYLKCSNEGNNPSIKNTAFQKAMIIGANAGHNSKGDESSCLKSFRLQSIGLQRRTR